MASRVAIVFGTYNRIKLLKKAIASVRAGVGSLHYEIVVVDGGSTDGSREWLASQRDVVLIGQRGPLTGAVRAFNLGFAYAVDHHFDFVAHLNDDAELVTKHGLEEAVKILRNNPKVGEVAFTFDLYGHWSFDHVNGKPYANFGIIRREAGEAVARAQGDSNGRLWWNPIYKTYGADSEFGVWLWKLGWEVHTANDIQVHDCQEMDALREGNHASNPDRLDSKLFWSRWGNEDYTTRELPSTSVAAPHPNGTNVLVTGGYGFLGSALTRKLRENSHNVVTTFRSNQVDLRDKKATISLFKATKPKTVFHLAAKCGGIGANQRKAVEFFQDNMEMGINVLEASKEAGVEHVIVAGTVCSYPCHTAVPFKEINLWSGFPEPTNAAYGVAKRALLTLMQAYKTQYGLRSTMAICANLYGPGDNFDLETSHVIPAIIRRMLDAQEKEQQEVTLWGSGYPTRDFLFVDDAVNVLQLISEKTDFSYDVLNVGTGLPIAIHEVAAHIKHILRFSGRIHWDRTKPDGQLKRQLSTTRCTELGYTAFQPFLGGLVKTVGWYKANINKLEK